MRHTTQWALVGKDFIYNGVTGMSIWMMAVFGKDRLRPNRPYLGRGWCMAQWGLCWALQRDLAEKHM